MDNPSTQWKTERQKEERRLRYERMKNADGSKRPVSPGSFNRTPRILFRIAVLVAALAVVVWSLIQLGVPALVVPPLKVGAVDIKGPEFGFYYKVLLSNYYIDPSTADGKAYLAEKCTVEGSTDKTWKQYFEQQVADQIRDLVIESETAKSEGIALTDAEVQSVKDIITNFVSQQENENKAIQYLEQNYAKGLNLVNLQEILLRQTLATKYAKLKTAGFEVTDKRISDYYAANKNDLDLVSYRSFFVKTTYATGATEEEKKAADKAAKAKADSLLAQVTDEASFQAMYEANTPSPTPTPTPTPKPTATPVPTGSTPTPTPTPKPTATPTPTPTEGPSPTPSPTPDPSLDEDQVKSSVSYYGTELATWLFDASRKAGEKAVVAGTSGSSDGYYVVYFVGRRMDDDSLKTVRHILVAVDRTTATQDEIDKAKADAEAILEQVTDEASFEALAASKSADTGSAAEGGLIAGFGKGEMVTEFEDWAFDPVRRAGDTGIVQTDYGFHILWFVESVAKYRYDIEQTLRSDDMNAWLEEQRKLDKFKVTKSQAIMDASVL